MTGDALPRGSFLRTFGLVFAAIASLVAIDTFLAREEAAEDQVQATRLFEEGRALLADGRGAQAIERIQDAISIERGNRDYLRTLAQAQLSSGNTAAAEATLDDLLQSDSTDGLANLIFARTLAREGRFPDAVRYFHRAVYGRWNNDEAANRLRARFELIDLLAEHNSKEELLAELLPVEDQAPRDLKSRARMGRLFLAAGSPARAGEIFEAMVREAPMDADGHAGLGEADFERANYLTARWEFQAAARLSPEDQATRRRLELCDELLMLDPSLRGLGAAERLRRSLTLTEMTLDQVMKCAQQQPQLQDLMEKAAGALNAHVPSSRQSDAAESNLDLVEQLWQARKAGCAEPAADSPLALVLAKLRQ